MGRAAVKRLRQEGAQRVIVVNRTLARSRDLVGEAGFGEAVEMPELAAALADSRRRRRVDGLVALRARRRERRRGDGSARPQRPLFIVDIAVPRDVDPAVAEIRQRRRSSTSTA